MEAVESINKAIDLLQANPNHSPKDVEYLEMIRETYRQGKIP